jgi:L-rhamnose-H+ transport protein
MNGSLVNILKGTGANFIIIGIVLGAIGIAICGIAGRRKEKDIELQNANSNSSFSLSKGLPLCIFAGILSALYGFSITAGTSISEIAAKYGAGDYKLNVVYIFSNSGAFVTTLIYCLYLHNKEKTFKEYLRSSGNIGSNFIMAIITGVLWYSQFFFYGIGHVNLGKYEFSSWAIHMIMLVLFSTIAGIVIKEWSMCSSKTIRTLVIAIFILITAVVILTYGNYLGSVSA